MSKWKNKDGKTVRRNQIATQFAWQSIEMLELPAYRALSLSGHRILGAYSDRARPSRWQGERQAAGDIP